MLRLIAALAIASFFPTHTAASAQAPKEIPIAHHAQGTFTVDMKPLSPAPADSLSRFSIDKKLTGGLEGTSKGEMLAGGDYTKGAAGYVAIEVFTGTLAGKHGSFALQHSATMDASGPKMNIIVTPGSGTGDLKGIAGTFTIIMANGGHSYEFEYTLPE